MSICSIRHRIGMVVAFLLIVLLFTPSTWSWGRLGHRVAARMAEGRLTPHELSAVHDVLGPEVSLADISTWADEQREIPGTGPWHYVNMPITESRYDPKFCPPLYTPIDFVDNRLDSTPILQRMSPEMLWDRFAKRVILEIYEAMAESIRIACSYQTHLDC